MRRMLPYGVMLATALVLTGYVGLSAAEYKDQAELAKQLAGAPVTLEQGLRASEPQGSPISGKFEVEDNVFQLSVYTAKGGKYREVIVDWKTGKVAKSEPLKGADDLKDAKAQSAAMAKAKTTLRAAVENAVAANPGFRASAAIPALEKGKPVATVTLVKGTQFKTEKEKLD